MISAWELSNPIPKHGFCRKINFGRVLRIFLKITENAMKRYLFCFKKVVGIRIGVAVWRKIIKTGVFVKFQEIYENIGKL